MMIISPMEQEGLAVTETKLWNLPCNGRKTNYGDLSQDKIYGGKHSYIKKYTNANHLQSLDQPLVDRRGFSIWKLCNVSTSLIQGCIYWFPRIHYLIRMS